MFCFLTFFADFFRFIRNPFDTYFDVKAIGLLRGTGIGHPEEVLTVIGMFMHFDRPYIQHS